METHSLTLFAADPLLSQGVDLTAVLIVLGKVVAVFVLLLVATMFMVWFERKLHADMSNRIGPNLAGPFGILQTLADGIKLFFKEDLVPTRAERRVFMLAPFLSFVPAFLLFAIVPIGGDFHTGNGIVTMFGRDTYLQVADPPIGVLFALAMSSIAVYGIMLAGWASGSKYPLLGAVRATAQMVSYEAAMGLSLMAVVLLSGQLGTHDIVAWQAGEGPFGVVPKWAVFMTLLVPFVVFVIAGTAELNRPPFDLVEAEQELVGGFNTEYSSIRFALFYLAEFMNVVTMSALFTTIFLGGPAGWHPDLGPGWLWGTAWFVVKVLGFLFMFVWFRATLPRFRYDQLMDFGWKLLIPLALAWLVLLATIVLARREAWNPAVTAAGVIVVGLGGYSLLRSAISAGHARRDANEGVSV